MIYCEVHQKMLFTFTKHVILIMDAQSSHVPNSRISLPATLVPKVTVSPNEKRKPAGFGFSLAASNRNKLLCPTVGHVSQTVPTRLHHVSLSNFHRMERSTP